MAEFMQEGITQIALITLKSRLSEEKLAPGF